MLFEISRNHLSRFMSFKCLISDPETFSYLQIQSNNFQYEIPEIVGPVTFPPTENLKEAEK